jgi:parvulin-like peptidyl-prolyl isomerase
MHKRLIQALVACAALAATVYACSPPTQITEEIAAATPTIPLTPTPTSEPLAASVNGENITLRFFEEEFARYETAQALSGTDLASGSKAHFTVLNALIDLKLLAQGARNQGISVDLNERLSEIEEQLGGAVAFSDMLIENGYSVDSFEYSLAESMLADEMVRLLAGQMPETFDQVHARHILVADRSQAEQLRQEIANGADFAVLARAFSLDLSTRPAGGDLGWFPTGILTTPEVEQHAFEMQPGEISEVIESHLGFHIIEVLEREDRAAHGMALTVMRRQAVEQWLQQQRLGAAIEVYLAP